MEITVGVCRTVSGDQQIGAVEIPVSYTHLNYKYTALVVGFICIIGALFSGILDVFLNFVNLIAVLFMPIFAIMIVDFFILKKQHINTDAVIYTDKIRCV